MSRQIQVVGMDPSFNNWGLASGLLDIDSGEFELRQLSVISPVPMVGAQVRVNSKDLHRASQLYHPVMDFLKGADLVFVEVPVGSQSAKGAKAYGVCIGILSVIAQTGHQFITVTPDAVKQSGPGIKNASKAQMIKWATDTYPDGPWPTVTQKGVTRYNATVAEHMADAVAAIHAGVATPDFNQVLPAFRRAMQ